MAWPGVINAYREFLPVTDSTPVITLLEGNTILIPAPRLGKELGIDLWLKFEGLNPTGSFKDRGMTMAMTKAVEAGAQAVICASTGNTSAAAAAYAARAGIACYVVIPDGAVALGKLAQGMMYGAKVLQIDGNFDDGLKLVRRLSQEHPEIALVNSVNPYRIEGQKTAAFEVVDQLGKAPDILAIPVGNAGNITAYWRGFNQYAQVGRTPDGKLPHMWGFQAAGAAPLVNGAEIDDPKTIATAIKIGRPATAEGAKAAVRESAGGFWAVTDQEIEQASQRMAAAEGVFAEPGSCASIAGLIQAAAAGRIPAGRPTVVAVLTGHGLKDPETAIRISSRPVKVGNQYEALLAEVRHG